MKEKIKTFNKGLHSDNSPELQPESTYRYALNAVNETVDGEILSLSNEKGNIKCGELKNGYIPLGTISLNEDESVVFSVNPEKNISEIGILTEDCKYTTHVNDRNSSQSEKLNFKVTKQIKGVYRLRRGCGRTIYFNNGDGIPLNYNFDKPDNFKTNGKWDIAKFKLIKTYSKVPKFQKIKVNNYGGELKSGSIIIAIQYLDEDLNPTEWITTSQPINIYVDSLESDFKNIRGSVNSDLEYLDFPLTNKSITITLDNLDEKFPFYKLAFLSANNNTGKINDVKLSKPLNTVYDTFTYTGINFETEGTKEEILMFQNVIDSVETIEQIENRLILGNIKGKQINYCELQKYASKITADAYLKDVYINNIYDENSPKNPLVKFNGSFYMPGEIYSFGIVYILDDGSVTPAYHIPGKSNNILDTEGNNVSEGIIFSPGENVYPMALNNTSKNLTYIDRGKCKNFNYWGFDSEGQNLKGQLVRHHRFPTRKKLQIPLIEEIRNDEDKKLNYLNIDLHGTFDTSCSPNCNHFSIILTFDVDGVEQTIITPIDKNTIANPVNINIISDGYIGNIDMSSINITAEYDDNSDASVELDNININSHITIKREQVNVLYKTKVFGIKFSNIDLPNKNILNGNKIIGYYIVRQERKDEYKTILDSAVITPMIKNKKYVAHGLLNPNMNFDDWDMQAGRNNSVNEHNKEDNLKRHSKEYFSFINPEFKFNKKEFSSISKISHQGTFNVRDVAYSKFRIQDVIDGSSYDEENNSDTTADTSDGGEVSTKDDDGWSLKVITRDTDLKFDTEYDKWNINSSEIDDITYLSALESVSTISNTDDKINTVSNIAADNKIGILQLKNEKQDISVLKNNYPYVYFEQELFDYYPNFRLENYYKVSNNFENFDTLTNNSTIVFGGDTYLSSMKYVNTVFFQNQVAYRRAKGEWWKYIVAVVLILAAVLIFIATDALGTEASIYLISLGIGMLGTAAYLAESGISHELWIKMYSEEYEKGLRETALDKFIGDEFKFYNEANNSQHGFSTISTFDDEIEWIGDALTNLWFESSINFSLRNGMSKGNVSFFMDSPSTIEDGNMHETQVFISQPTIGNGQDAWVMGDDSILPQTAFDKYMFQKLTIPDNDRDGNRRFIPPLPEYYNINKDFHIMNIGKIYNMLPFEYDCCTNCREKFPHRIVYSQQSFQEELTDNYKVFLPNNYRDIEGMTGDITDIVRLKNNLYIFTEESLWHLPQNLQERVDNNIITFIGTGSYFNLPPKKIVDDDLNSAGTKYPFATLKTEYGIFYISNRDRNIYLFNGNQLKNLTLKGLHSFSKNNVNLIANKEYKEISNNEYPFINNPSYKNGIGYTSVYDSEYDRFIITKKDFEINKQLLDNYDDFIIIECNGNLILFNNVTTTIQTYELQGWRYLGIKNCKMVFKRDEISTSTIQRDIIESIPNDTDIHVVYDTSGSFGISIEGSRLLNNDDDLGQELTSIDNAINDWIQNYSTLNPNWIGNVYKYIDSSERWLRFPQLMINEVYQNQNTNNKNVLLISFINESHDKYHSSTFNNHIDGPAPSSYFLDDYDKFTGSNLNGNNPNNFSIYDIFNSFIGIHYPIVFPDSIVTKVFLKESLAAIKGIDFTQSDVNSLNENIGIESGNSSIDWNDFKNSLLTSNLYPDNGLENYGWKIQEDRYKHPNGKIINSLEFQNDIQNLLKGSITTSTIDTIINNISEHYEYINGISLTTDLYDNNNSFTLSYSLLSNNWASYHSYLPYIYIPFKNTFFSWKNINKHSFNIQKIEQQGNNNIPELQSWLWKHNSNIHGNFYDNQYPFIIEIILSQGPTMTKIFEWIKFNTLANKYLPEYKEYIEKKDITFDKLLVYNNRQISGWLDIKSKDIDNQDDYIANQIQNISLNVIPLEKRERDWFVNGFRDLRAKYDTPMFDRNLDSLQQEYFTDKIVNDSVIDVMKDWQSLEKFRDKYLAVRFLFSNFEDVKLLFNYVSENETISYK